MWVGGACACIVWVCVSPGERRRVYVRGERKEVGVRACEGGERGGCVCV